MVLLMAIRKQIIVPDDVDARLRLTMDEHLGAVRLAINLIVTRV
jgi:hypothetical protein